jgi:hypothetical protein
MRAVGYFTPSDRATLQRAAHLAEGLTQRFFNLDRGVWMRNPYALFTRREVGKTLFHDDAFANIVRIEASHPLARNLRAKSLYGIVLHDPNILLALLRSSRHDLWALGLFILTHELIHIVRFREFNVDFFASSVERDEEERVVHSMTREILAGISPIDHIIDLYNCQSRDTN